MLQLIKNLRSPERRNYKIRICFNMFYYRIFVLCKSEKIIFFGNNFRFALMVRTKSVFRQVFFTQERFTSGTIQSCIRMFIYIAFVMKFFKNLVILKFEGIDNINDVISYKGMDLLIPREEGVELDEDEYYIADLIGMEVYLEDGALYGTLKDVMETGANDVYIVKKKGGGEILLPAIHECILDVNPEEGKMTVHLMKGLE